MSHIGKPIIQKIATFIMPMLNNNISYLEQPKKDNLIKIDKVETDKIMKHIDDDIFSDAFDDDDLDPKFISP